MSVDCLEIGEGRWDDEVRFDRMREKEEKEEKEERGGREAEERAAQAPSPRRMVGVDQSQGSEVGRRMGHAKLCKNVNQVTARGSSEVHGECAEQ